MATADSLRLRLYNSKGAVDTLLYSEANRQSCPCDSKEGLAEICSLYWQDARAIHKPYPQAKQALYFNIWRC